MSNIYNIANFLLVFLGSITVVMLSEDCIDKSPYCNAKDCTVRPGYAREYCKRTCGNCTEICFNSHFVPCKDEQKSECDAMLKDYCPLLCGVCKPARKKEKVKIQKVQMRTPIVAPASTLPTTTLTTSRPSTTRYVEVSESMTRPATVTSTLPLSTTTAMQYVRPPVFSAPPRVVPHIAHNSIETVGEPLNIDVESEKAAPIDQGIPVINSQGGPSLMAHPGGGLIPTGQRVQMQTRLKYPEFEYPERQANHNGPDPLTLRPRQQQIPQAGGQWNPQNQESFAPHVNNRSTFVLPQPPEPVSLWQNYPLPMSNLQPKHTAEADQTNAMPPSRYTPGIFHPTASLYGPSQHLSSAYQIRRKPALNQMLHFPMTPSVYSQPRLWGYHEPQVEQDIQRRPSYHGAHIEAEFPTRPSMAPYSASSGYGYGPKMAVPNLIQLLVNSKIGANWFESLEVGLFDLLEKFNGILSAGVSEGCRDRDPSTCSRITEETCYSRPGFYLKLCPVTCKNCNGMQCYDSIKVDCEEVLRVGGCRLPTAGEYCPRTCRLCPTPPQLSEAVSPCRDELDNCDQLASSGVCEHSHSRETLRVYCARSCGFCKEPQYYMDDTSYFRTRNKMSKYKKLRKNFN